VPDATTLVPTAWARGGALVSLGARRFARVFKRHTTVSPDAYLECIRIRNVQALLDRVHTLASAAAAAGLADQSHLIQRFKRFLEITPGEYVRQRRVQAPSDLRSKGLTAEREFPLLLGRAGSRLGSSR